MTERRTALSPEAEAIVQVAHPNPHSYLGIHEVDHEAWLRVWRPEAARVAAVLPDDTRVELEMRHGAGLFEGRLPEAVDRYRLEISFHSGDVLVTDDPYRFWPTLGDVDLHLIGEGRHERLWEVLGAHRMEHQGVDGTAFAVWAPAATSVRVTGDFNFWNGRTHPMRSLGSSGVWELFVPQVPEEGERPLSYVELADQLSAYVSHLEFTHIELMPVMEHPYGGSWGYQVSGYYAPTSRFGTPDDLRYFVDRMHQSGVGVIVDWVPAHFPRDEWALARFDGTALYEHADPRLGEHPDWGTLVFNFGRHEVRDFLLANALYWIEEFHMDGLRVDAVASMLYLDYSREPGQWVPNIYGGRENLQAIAFLQEFNSVVHLRHPGVLTIAEESTAWGGVSRPVHLGGLGFTHKWNMGWMHDTLGYFGQDPVHRKWHHHELTFGLIYAWTENFVLPLSHDEVVHLKRSLLAKMRLRRPPGGAVAGARDQPRAGGRARPVGRRLLTQGVPVDRRQRQRPQRLLVPALQRWRRTTGGVHRQPHPGAEARLPGGAAEHRAVGRAAEHRRHPVGRQRDRELGREDRRHPVAGLRPVGRPHPPPVGRDLARPG